MCNYLKVKPGNKQSVKLSSLQREEEGGKVAGNNPKERGHAAWRGPPEPFLWLFLQSPCQIHKQVLFWAVSTCHNDLGFS